VATENVAFLVVDIGAAHSLEVERQIVAPLVDAGSRSDSSGPYAAVGRITSTMLEAARLTPPPTPTGTPLERAPTMPFSAYGAKTPDPHSLTALMAARAATKATAASVDTAPLVATPELMVLAPAQEPASEDLDPLAEVLREYPEVEWAAICATSQGTGRSRPTIAIRIDPSYRTRVADIAAALRRTSAGTGALLEVLLLDDPELVRAARGDGVVFYPWRRS
jgi:hypothetical protein